MWQCMRYTVRSSPGYGDLWVSWKPSSETQASLSYTDHRPQANSIIFLSRSVSRTLPMLFFFLFGWFFFAFLCYCFNFFFRKKVWYQVIANARKHLNWQPLKIREITLFVRLNSYKYLWNQQKNQEISTVSMDKCIWNWSWVSHSDH